MLSLEIIPPRVAFVDPRTGMISREWFRFLLNQFNRVIEITTVIGSGAIHMPGIDGEDGDEGMMGRPGADGLNGTNGLTIPGFDGADGEDMWPSMATRSPASAPLTVSVGASPFVYSAPFDGNVIVSGGGVSDMEFSRDSGATFTSVGVFYSPFYMRGGDQFRVTYIGAPTMLFIPL